MSKSHFPPRQPPAPAANNDYALALDFYERLKRSGADTAYLLAEDTRLEILKDFSGIKPSGFQSPLKVDWYRSESLRRVVMDLVRVEADDAAEAGKPIP